MAIRWVSTPESVENNEISVLAVVETFLAMAVSIAIAVIWDTYVHIAFGAAIAPFLLMKTAYAADLAHRIFFAIFDSRFVGEVLPAPAAYVTLITALPLIQLTAGVSAFLVHPVLSVMAISTNWRLTALVVDSKRSPYFFPHSERYKERSPSALNLTTRVLLRIWPSRVVSKKIATLVLLAPVVSPAYLYRWSIMSTAIIWFPLLWALQVRHKGEGVAASFLGSYIREPLTIIVLILSVISIVSLLAKFALMQTMAGFADWWNQGPLREFFSLYVAPTEIQWWQIAVLINSVLAIVMFLYAWHCLVQVKHEQIEENTDFPRRVMRGGLFIRRVLTCYTIACTLYITINAATNWNWPPLGTKVFPWW